MRLILPLLLTACGTSGGAPTWHQDIAPIVAENCGSCHTDGGIAPMSFDTYEQADAAAFAMLAAIDRGQMPPFLAQETEDCAPTRPWKDDMRLSDEEIALITEWIEADRPEGNPNKATELPPPRDPSIADPSVSLPFQNSFVVEGDHDLFQCFVLDPGNTENMWVDAIQLVPGNPRVDHHGLVFVDVNGEADALAGPDGSFPCFNNPRLDGYLMATWVPGALPMRTPETAAMPLPAGAKIVVQMHYHPVPGESHEDQSTVDLTWSSETPEWAAAQALVGNYGSLSGDGTGLQPGPNDELNGNTDPKFFIPAGARNHTETMIYEQSIPLDLPLFSVGTHMHYVGTDMTIQLKKQGEEDECLLGTPAWDFNWQRTYDFDVPIDELPVVSQGDQLHMTCTFDNSMDNPFVADALAEQGISEPQDVYLGEETLDEMCLGLFGILVPPALVETLY
ncbi:MAG: hypothetical protein EP330_13675 [Deltaproteobacteria bacterium]|nr:MAG: hypothetical protein EP330_13675 [Deltaproteobacteria bacterium]